MKRTVFILLGITAAFSVNAQSLFDEFFGRKPGYQVKTASEENKPKLVYDLDAQYHFDNREFDVAHELYTQSMTNHGISVAPFVGLSLFQGGKAEHRLMAGVEAFHLMGTPTALKDTDVSLYLYYQGSVRTRRGTFTGTAGVYPTSMRYDGYGESFFSDSLKFYDRELEGLLLQYNTGRFRSELGLDWMGRYGYDVKERFQIYSSGRWNMTNWLTLGWAASMYHYAGSVTAKGVVDNHLLNPYVRFRLGHALGIQDLSLKAGALASYQWDRVRESGASVHMGGEAVFNVRNWNLGLRNTFYAGPDLQPLYDGTDTGGNKYGYMLYFGSPFYRGMYNLTEAYWNPYISKYVSLQFVLRFHFNADGYLGCQQVFDVKFDLEGIRDNAATHRKSKPRRSYPMTKEGVIAL